MADPITFDFFLNVLDKSGIVVVTALLLYDKMKTNGLLRKAVENNTLAILELNHKFNDHLLHINHNTK